MNRKKRHPVFAAFAILITVSFALSCGGKKLRQEERWEGLEGSRLRILVRHEFTGEPGDGDEEKLILECLEKGVILHSDCGDMECRALIDFDMDPVMKMLEGKAQ